MNNLTILSPREFKRIKKDLMHKREIICLNREAFLKVVTVARNFPSIHRAKIIKAYDDERE